MVRALDNKTAKRINAKNPPELIFFDPDGQEIHRGSASSQSNVENSFRGALNKYRDQEIPWASGSFDENARDTQSDKLVAMIFVDDKKPSKKFLMAIEDRWLAQYQKRIVFILTKYDKKSDLCREWKVITAPTMLLVNPKESNARKRILGKTIAKKDVRNLRMAILKALKKLDKLNK